MSTEQRKQEEMEERRTTQEAVRAQAVKVRQHVRARVTKLSNKFGEFQSAYPGESAEEPVAFSQLTALHSSLEPLAKQLIKLDSEVLSTFQPDFESEDQQADEEDKAAEYEELVVQMEAFYLMLIDNRKVTVEVKINTLRAAIPGLPFAPTVTSTPDLRGEEV